MSDTKKSQLAEIAEALLIFDKYEDPWPFLSAEHDIIYAGSPNLVSEEDVALLKELGWHIDEDNDCFSRFV